MQLASTDRPTERRLNVRGKYQSYQYSLAQTKEDRPTTNGRSGRRGEREGQTSPERASERASKQAAIQQARKLVGRTLRKERQRIGGEEEHSIHATELLSAPAKSYKSVLARNLGWPAGWLPVCSQSLGRSKRTHPNLNPQRHSHAYGGKRPWWWSVQSSLVAKSFNWLAFWCSQPSSGALWLAAE